MNTLLSTKLKELRLGVGVTQKKLGEALQLSNLYKSPPSKIVADYESGLRTPTIEVISRYSNYFMLHPGHLKALRQKSTAQQAEKKLKRCKTELSRILKKARLDAGLTMQETGLKLGLGDFYPPIAKNPDAVKGRMSSWETGRKHPKAEVLQRYVERFGISISDECLHHNRESLPKPQSLCEDMPLQRTETRKSVSVATNDTSEVARTYYRCTKRDRYGIPIEIERHHYDENRELIKIEKREVLRD